MGLWQVIKTGWGGDEGCQLSGGWGHQPGIRIGGKPRRDRNQSTLIRCAVVLASRTRWGSDEPETKRVHGEWFVVSSQSLAFLVSLFSRSMACESQCRALLILRRTAVLACRHILMEPNKSPDLFRGPGSVLACQLIRNLWDCPGFLMIDSASGN